MIFCITLKCSKQCPHCFLNCHEYGVSCNRNVLHKTLEFFRKSGSKYLNISGGEPTEHPHFLSYFETILKTVHRRKSIALLTNGQFLFDDVITKSLAKLHKKYSFDIQITSVGGLYPGHWDTVSQYREKLHLFENGHIRLVTQLVCMEDMGRAKGKDWSHLGKFYQRKVAHCFNLFSLAKSGQFTSMRQVFKYIDKNLEMYKCKPFIDPLGYIHPGETTHCEPIGNVQKDDMKTIFENLINSQPCGKCS